MTIYLSIYLSIYLFMPIYRHVLQYGQCHSHFKSLTKKTFKCTEKFFHFFFVVYWILIQSIRQLYLWVQISYSHIWQFYRIFMGFTAFTAFSDSIGKIYGFVEIHNLNKQIIERIEVIGIHSFYKQHHTHTE